MNHSTERASKPIPHLAETITLPDRTGMEKLPIKDRFIKRSEVNHQRDGKMRSIWPQSRIKPAQTISSDMW